MFNKVRLSVVCLLIGAALFTGCRDNPDENNPPDDPEEWTDGQNVYVTGFETVQKNSVARLWKNGTVQNLAGSSGSLLRSTSTSAVISSEARSVFVSGDDVYVAGWDVIVTGDKWIESGGEIITNGDEVIGRARLWKNGEMQNLSSGTFSDQAFSVFVSDDDVYVLGREALQPAPFPSSWAFKVWKNGEVEIIAEGTSDCQVNSIFVSDGKVYVAGRRRTPSGLQATLWINGKPEDLVCEPSNSCANFVFVLDGNVYVAGNGSYSYAMQGNSTLIAPAALLWKNGKVEKLTDSPQNADAFSVYVSDDGDVYVAGYEGDNAKLWKNGIVQNIPDDARMYRSVFVKDNDVYTAGYVEAIQEVEPGSGIIPYHYLKATLWKNGKKLNLKVGQSNSWAFSVFVK
jgi:hypothetical protein